MSVLGETSGAYGEGGAMPWTAVLLRESPVGLGWNQRTLPVKTHEASVLNILSAACSGNVLHRGSLVHFFSMKGEHFSLKWLLVYYALLWWEVDGYAVLIPKKASCVCSSLLFLSDWSLSRSWLCCHCCGVWMIFLAIFLSGKFFLEITWRSHKACQMLIWANSIQQHPLCRLMTMLWGRKGDSVSPVSSVALAHLLVRL